MDQGSQSLTFTVREISKLIGGFWLDKTGLNDLSKFIIFEMCGL